MAQLLNMVPTLLLAAFGLVIHWTRAQTVQSTTPTPSSTYRTDIPSVWVPQSSTTVMPSLVFSSVPTLTACATAQIDWTLHNDTGLVNFDITLNVAAVAEEKSDGKNLNMTLTTEDAMIPSHYDLDVALPLGRYFFQGVINDIYGTTGKSNVFDVVQGQNTSCLNATDVALPSASPSSSAGASGSSHFPAGAIAGIVIGAILIVAIVTALLFYRRRVKGRRQAVDGAWIGDRYTPGMGSDMLYSNRVASPLPADPSGRRHLGSGSLGISTHTLSDPSTEMSETSRSAENPFSSKEDDQQLVGFAAYLRGR